MTPHPPGTEPATGGEAPSEERKYPCDDCGKLRTKAEGGTVFTVCDECWKKNYPTTPTATPEKFEDTYNWEPPPPTDCGEVALGSEFTAAPTTGGERERTMSNREPGTGCLGVILWLILAACILWFFANYQFRCSNPYWDYRTNSIGYVCAWEKRQ